MNPMVQIGVGIVCCVVFACVFAAAVDRALLWRDRRRGKRQTLAEKQAAEAENEWNVAAIIEGVEAFLRAEREVSE